MNARCAVCGSIEELFECYTCCAECSSSYCVGCFSLNAIDGEVSISVEKHEKRANDCTFTVTKIAGPCLMCTGRESDLEAAKKTALYRRKGYRGCFVCRYVVGEGFYCKECNRKLCQECSDRYVHHDCPFCADDARTDKIIDNMLSMMIFDGQVENIISLAGQKIDDVRAAAKSNIKSNIKSKKRPAD